MKWLGGTIAGVFLGLIGLSAFLAVRAGALLPVEVQVKTQSPLGPYQMLYKEVVGPYHKISQDLFEIENFAKKYNVICPLTIGHYLDNPNQVEHERLRSRVGCLFKDPDFKPQKAFPAEVLKAKNYKTKDLKISKYIVGSFKGSPALVAFKVYPKLRETAKKQRLKLANDSYEIYEVHSSKSVLTKVIFPIQN